MHVSAFPNVRVHIFTSIPQSATERKMHCSNDMQHLQAHGRARCQSSPASCMQRATYLAHAVTAKAFAVRVTVSIPALYPSRAVAASIVAMASFLQA